MAKDSLDVDAVVREIENRGGVIIRGFRSRDELIRSMQAAIDDGKKCAFVPTLKTLREFLNTDGFVSVMTEVNSQLRSHMVLVEPNAYGARHIFAVGPSQKSCM